MKISNILLCILFSILLCNCASKKKITQSQKIQVDYSEIYCGGAAPMEEMLKEMLKMKPFADQEIEVYQDRELIQKASKYKTDALGEFWLPKTKEQIVFISIYPSSTPSDDPAYDKCYREFIIQHLIPVDLANKQEVLKVLAKKECNSCLPPAP